MNKRQLEATVARRRLAVIGKALAWWNNHRPVAWKEPEHRKNPTVNCVGQSAQDLARAVVRLKEALKARGKYASPSTTGRKP